ncbi:hypothetical protein DRN32_00735 [Thermococci archaeon]|nr:MAG: hypothetical protein DRN32_00735 [Thermococci archaeon]
MLARLCTALNRFFPTPPHPSGRDSPTSYATNQFQRAAQRYHQFLRSLVHFAGRDLLDVGCGYGGKTLFYAVKTGPHSVTGMDISDEVLWFARRFAAQSAASLRWVRGSVECLPYADESFDIVIAEDVFEHVSDPDAGLQECKRVLRAEGILIVIIDPLYHSCYGSHLYDYIYVPWAHLIFPKSALISAVREQSSVGPVLDPARAIALFCGLNQLTVVQFDRLVRNLDMRPVYTERRTSNDWRARLPLIRLLFIEAVTYVLQKPTSTSEDAL